MYAHPPGVSYSIVSLTSNTRLLGGPCQFWEMGRLAFLRLSFGWGHVTLVLVNLSYLAGIIFSAMSSSKAPLVSATADLAIRDARVQR